MVLEQRSSLEISDISRSQLEILHGVETVLDVLDTLLIILKHLMDQCIVKDSNFQAELEAAKQAFTKVRLDLKQLADHKDELNESQENILSKLQSLGHAIETSCDKLTLHHEYTRQLNTDIQSNLVNLLDSYRTRNLQDNSDIVQQVKVEMFTVKDSLQKLLEMQFDDKYLDSKGNDLTTQTFLKKWFGRSLASFFSTNLFNLLVFLFLYWYAKTINRDLHKKYEKTYGNQTQVQTK